MAFHPHRSLKLAFFALALLAAALLVFAGSALAKGCSGKTQTWKVNGRSVCLKTARARAGHGAIETNARISRWFDALQTPKTRKGVKLPAKLTGARTRARAESATLKVIAKAQSASRHARMPKAFAAGAARGGVVETLSEDVGSATTSDGVTITAHVDAVAYEDGSTTYDASVTAKLGDSAVKFQPYIDTRSALVPEVTCPTAAGKLSIDYGFTTGGTYSGFKKGKIVGAYTLKSSETLHAEGQVGRDARLQSVRSHVTQKDEQYARGVQLVTTTAGDFTISRDGDPVQQGPLSADVSVKVAGATRSQERAAESSAAASLAGDADSISALSSKAEIGRWRMKLDEHKWYDPPFQCASLRYSPDSIATLAAGKSTDVTARIVSQADGADGAGSIAIESVSRGQLSVTKSELDPGSPARMHATAASPDTDKTTVASSIIGASTAGRVQWGWYARDDLELPKKISGVVASWQEIPGASKSYFHSWVVYTLENTYVSDDGYISAFYKLTTADQDEVENTIGPDGGCRYYAKASGGTIADGDLELRKAPGGKWQHAVMYDVEVPGQTYNAVDCGPSPPPSFTGDVVGFLNMAMLGGGFYDVEDGFHMQQTALSYADPASGRKTVADWILDPGDPQ